MYYICIAIMSLTLMGCLDGEYYLTEEQRNNRILSGQYGDLEFTNEGDFFMWRCGTEGQFEYDLYYGELVVSVINPGHGETDCPTKGEHFCEVEWVAADIILRCDSEALSGFYINERTRVIY